MSHSRIGCALAALSLLVASAPAMSMQRGADAPAQAPRGPAPVAALQAGSEISVVESGGITGRMHSVRLVAGGGRVSVEYRPRTALPSAPALMGTLELDRYVALWRELEQADVWNVPAPQGTKGADLVHVEIRVRVGESARVLRWDEGAIQTAAIRKLAETASRVLAAGRDSAFVR
jgi:hypothetical protein